MSSINNRKIPGALYMKSLLFYLVFLTILFACNTKRKNFNFESDVAFLTYQAEFGYLNRTIMHYASLTKSGYQVGKQNEILDSNIIVLKDQLKEYGQISSQKKDSFFNYFEKVLKGDSLYVDLENFEELKKAPLITLSEIELLGLYFKRGLVSKLLDNKILPFDTWSAMATVNSWTIKDGEEFMMQMNTTAFDSHQPSEWYILKEDDKGLTKDNIADTLYPDALGATTFRTRQYHKGENQINVYVKLKTINGEQIIKKVIVYTVE